MVPERTVLHVMQAAGMGGAERHLITLLPALRARGWDVRFWGFTIEKSSSFAEALAETGVPVSLRHCRRLREPSVVLSLRSAIRRLKPSIVHTHLLYADLQGQLALLGLRIPSVRTVHGGTSIVGSGLSPWAFAAAGRFAKVTLAVSEHVADVIRRKHFASPRRLRVVHHGIDQATWAPSPSLRAQARAELGVGNDDIVVVCTSRLYPGKGQDALIRAFAIARRSVPTLHLVLAGAGAEEGRLRGLAGELLPEGSHQFTGYRSDIRPLLWAADVYVLPTSAELGEGFPVAPLEAAAAGVPMIASNLPPLRELIVDHETGILVEPGDVNALGDAIIETSNPELRARLSGTAAAVVASRFTRDKMVEGTLAIYEDLLARSSTSDS